MKISPNEKYTFIDLFAGAGGLSEGFIQAGFSPIAHVEMNKYAAETLVTRCGYYYLQENHKVEEYYKYLGGELSREGFLNLIPKRIKETIICEAMSNSSMNKIYRNIDGIMKVQGISKVDVIIGGPPCQAYSLVGRAQSSHMEVPMKDDHRNNLYLLYAKMLKKYKPKMFVFENVMGIKSANNRGTWKNIQAQLKRVGYEIECKEQNAKDFGVLQTRKRMIIIGWLKNSGLRYPEFLKVNEETTISQLLRDLPALHPGEESNKYSRKKACRYVEETGIRNASDILTLHKSRQNTVQDITIYKEAIRLWNDGHKRLNYNDLPEELKTHNNRTSFVDRFKVVEGDTPTCHTILAHLSKDGHYFIHPDIDQYRSITVREAARIQSFPDNYYFEGPRTAQFVQVGNAVPPMMAKIIADKIKEQLEK